MRLADMNWMQVQEHVKHDQRAVLPLGSTEQHGYLSLCVLKCNARSVVLLGKYTNTHGFTLDLGTQRSGLSLLAGDARRSPSGRNRCE